MSASLCSYNILKKDSKNYSKTNYEVYLFQTGVYKNYDYAQKESQQYSSAFIKNEEDLFHIYTNCLSNIDLINRLKNYYEAKKINYYLKSTSVDEKTYQSIQKYEERLSKSSDEELLKSGNDLLSIYFSYLDEFGQ